MIHYSTPDVEIAVSPRASLQAELLADDRWSHFDNGAEWISNPDRQDLWRLGRYFVARQSLQLMMSQLEWGRTRPRLVDLEVVTRNGLGRGTQPRVYFRGHMLPWRLSLSHTDDVFALVISRHAPSRVGVDVADGTAATMRSLRFWCTPKERGAFHDEDSQELIRFWALKEAIYKAVNCGEAFRPSHFEISTESEQTVCQWRGKRLLLDLAVTHQLSHGAWLAAVAVNDLKKVCH